MAWCTWLPHKASHNGWRYVERGPDTGVAFRASRNVMAIMRKLDPFPIPLHLVQEARLYAPGRPDLDALCHVLQDYSRLVAEVRQLKRRVQDLDRESADFDARLDAVQAACRAMLEL
ncbi:hypothetical protein D3C80_498590 [compost metagenome]